jgi:hypothetical protein
MAVCVVIFLLISALLLALFHHLRKFSYFKDRGIQEANSRNLLLGHTPEAFFKRKHLSCEVGRIYK